MNILMFTNTFTPHVGGVARSVQTLCSGLREQGHRVLVVAPFFEHTPPDEPDVIRVSALQHYRGSDFSLPLPFVPQIAPLLHRFAPDIVHTHHPFLLGDTALRVAAARSIPAVFTYHTRYEQYGHYAPADSVRFRQLVIKLSAGYCNLCDGVIAPSASLSRILAEQEIRVPVDVIPTGIPVEHYAAGNGRAARARLGIATDDFVVGYIGRLAPEKNLEFLAEAIAGFLADNERACCVFAGEGPLKSVIAGIFDAAGLSGRMIFAGHLDEQALADTYAGLDVFAFSSHTETQGMVLAEAMAAGTPVVAIDAPGVREIVRDGVNGRLLDRESRPAFIAALAGIAGLRDPERAAYRQAAIATASEFSTSRMIAQVLALYQRLLARRPARKDIDDSLWVLARRSIGEEWKILRNLAQALGETVAMSKAKK